VYYITYYLFHVEYYKQLSLSNPRRSFLKLEKKIIIFDEKLVSASFLFLGCAHLKARRVSGIMAIIFVVVVCGAMGGEEEKNDVLRLTRSHSL
jgi:hypothetical protein